MSGDCFEADRDLAAGRTYALDDVLAELDGRYVYVMGGKVTTSLYEPLLKGAEVDVPQPTHGWHMFWRQAR